VARASQETQQHQAERRLPVRVCIAAPPQGLGRQLALMGAWLDQYCGAAGWSSAPAGTLGVVNDAIAFYFASEVQAQAFVARFCCGYRFETSARHSAAGRDQPPLQPSTTDNTS